MEGILSSELGGKPAIEKDLIDGTPNIALTGEDEKRVADLIAVGAHS